MKGRQSSRSGPVSRVRLYLCAAVIVPLFVGGMLGLGIVAMIHTMRAQIQVVQVAEEGADTGWTSLGELPGMPEQLEVSDDGGLWARTQLLGSLARYRDGKWEVLRRDGLFARRNSPDGDFALVENHVWAVVEGHLVEFDGREWQTHKIPGPAADHLVAASAHATWVLGNDGVLKTWTGGQWDSADREPAPEVTRWNAETPYEAPDLVATDDGSLWVCSGPLWRKQRGEWTRVNCKDQALADVELLGYADHKLWLDHADGLAWISEDTKRCGLFSFDEMGLGRDDHVSGVYQLGDRVCTSGNRGIHVLDGQRWELKWPVPEGVYRCEGLAAADGRVYAVAVRPTPVPILWLGAPITALACGLALLAMRRFLRLKYSMFAVFGRRYLVAIGMMTLPVLFGGLLGASAGVLPIIAPVGVAMLFLVVPPMCAVMIVFKEHVARSVEVIRFQQIIPDEMPPAAGEWFEKNTPEVESLGFRRLGDYRLKQRTEHFARFFVHPDGDVFGEICWTRTSPWKVLRCFSCFSVTDDQTYLETGNLDSTTGVEDERFVLQSVPKATVAVALGAHRGRLEQLAGTRNTRPLRLTENDLERVVLYGQKQCYDHARRQGLIVWNPYEEVGWNGDGRDSPERESPSIGAHGGLGSGSLPLPDNMDGWNSPHHVG